MRQICGHSRNCQRLGWDPQQLFVLQLLCNIMQLCIGKKEFGALSQLLLETIQNSLLLTDFPTHTKHKHYVMLSEKKKMLVNVLGGLHILFP